MSEQEENHRNSNNNNIQYFIDHEKNILNEERSSRGIHDATVRTRADFRVMRCFCGCTALTHEQIENFAMMSVSGLIAHPTGSTLFRNFLQIGHRADKSEALILFECHEICKKILENPQLVHDQSTVDQLLSLCPSYAFEQKITDTFRSDQEHKIVQTLRTLEQECVNSIECHNDYDRFRRLLLRKIGKS